MYIYIYIYPEMFSEPPRMFCTGPAGKRGSGPAGKRRSDPAGNRRSGPMYLIYSIIFSIFVLMYSLTPSLISSV